jgi:hypothetical protein
MAAAAGGMTVGGGAAVAGAMTGATMCMVIVTAELQVAGRRMVAEADMRAAAGAAGGMAAAGVSGEPHN